MTSVEFFVYWQHRILHSGVGYRCGAAAGQRRWQRAAAGGCGCTLPWDAARAGCACRCGLCRAGMPTSAHCLQHAPMCEYCTHTLFSLPPLQLAAQHPPQVQQGRPDEPVCRPGLPPAGRHHAGGTHSCLKLGFRLHHCSWSAPQSAATRHAAPAVPACARSRLLLRGARGPGASLELDLALPCKRAPALPPLAPSARRRCPTPGPSSTCPCTS